MKKIYLFALGVVCLSACKKDSENTPSKTDLLTSKNWRITALTSTTTATGSNPSTTTTNQYNQLPACQKDNFFKFNTDKTMISDEGASKCSTTDPQTTSFKWDFSSDQSKLLVTASGSSSTTTDDIVELSATTMHLRETSSYVSGTTTYSTASDVTFTSF